MTRNSASDYWAVWLLCGIGNEAAMAVYAWGSNSYGTVHKLYNTKMTIL